MYGDKDDGIPAVARGCAYVVQIAHVHGQRSWRWRGGGRRRRIGWRMGRGRRGSDWRVGGGSRRWDWRIGRRGGWAAAKSAIHHQGKTLWPLWYVKAEIGRAHV